MKKQTIIFFFFVMISISFLGGLRFRIAGTPVFGPNTYSRETGPPKMVSDLFSIADPSGAFWLQVHNGKGGQNLVSSALIFINGIQVAGPEDFNQNIFGFSKDVTLQPNNVLEVELPGIPGSFLTIEIRRAKPNRHVSNAKGDLDGLNMGDLILLGWSLDESAKEYILFRSTSIDGPWVERGRIDDLAARTGGSKVDITPDARLMDLCYRVEALDANGNVIRRYEPICIPKFVEPQNQQGSLQNILPVSFRPKGSQRMDRRYFFRRVQVNSFPINELCLTDVQFVDTNTLNLDQIRDFLRDRGSFLQGEIRDVDGVLIDPAQEIFDAAQTSQISPQVILSTLQKEQRSITRTDRPPDANLSLIMGFGAPSTIRDQIRDGTAQFRRDFDRLSRGEPTAGGWQVGAPRNSLDPITVTPAAMAAAILYSYTPWVGEAWGGRSLIGGNALFCQLWEQFGFARSETIIEIFIPSFFINCTSAGQLCSPPFSIFIQTESLLQVEYTAPSTHCSSISLHIFVDGSLHQTTGFLGPGAGTGLLDLGPVSSGTHEISLQAEGQLGGCNIGDLASWSGSLRVFTSLFLGVEKI